MGFFKIVRYDVSMVSIRDRRYALNPFEPFDLDHNILDEGTRILVACAGVMDLLW